MGAVAGTIIEGKYRLERELGAGGMGAVWLATQLMVDRKVAVKLLHPAFIDQEELQQRFEVEAKAIGKLNHPNCITLYDFGFSEDLNAFYTVIEYIDGVSLDKKLGTNVDVVYVTNVIREIALALDHAHYHGILHRDLKPENVMIAKMTDGSEIIKVLDFGIARIVKGQFEEPNDESQRITKAGEVFGTPAYMSPEQARSIRRLTPAADLYSLGVMYYELLTGELPFFANSAFDLLMLHVTKPVPPIHRQDVPEPVKNIIYKLLEKDPSKRFQSGKDLVHEIADLDMSGIHTLDDGPTRIERVSTLIGTAATTNERTAPHLRALGLPQPSVESTTDRIESFDYADTDPSIQISRETSRPGMSTWSRISPQTEEGRRRTMVALTLAVVAMICLGVIMIVPTLLDSDESLAAEFDRPVDPVPEETIAKIEKAGLEPSEVGGPEVGGPEIEEVAEKKEPTIEAKIAPIKKKTRVRKKKPRKKKVAEKKTPTEEPKVKKKPPPSVKLPLSNEKLNLSD